MLAGLRRNRFARTSSAAWLRVPSFAAEERQWCFDSRRNADHRATGVAQNQPAHSAAQRGVQCVVPARADDKKVEVLAAQSELMRRAPVENNALGTDGKTCDDGVELVTSLAPEIVVEVEVAWPVRAD